MEQKQLRKRKQVIPLLSVLDASRKYKVHPNTVRSWVHRDGLRCYRKKDAGKMYFRQDDIEQFLEKFYISGELKHG